MAQKPLSPEDCRRVLDLVEEHGGNVSAASRASGIKRPTLEYRYLAAKQWAQSQRDMPSAAPLPPDDIPTDEIVALMRRRFDLRHANAQARRWREFQVPTDGELYR